MTAMMSCSAATRTRRASSSTSCCGAACTFDDVCANIATEAGIVGDHLRRHFWNLSNNEELASAIARVVSSDQPIGLKSEHAFKLESMGLVHRVGAHVRPRCALYRTYFKSALAGVV